MYKIFNRIIIVITYINLLGLFSNTICYGAQVENNDSNNLINNCINPIIEESIKTEELEYTEEYKEYIKLNEEEKMKYKITPAMYDVPMNQKEGEESQIESSSPADEESEEIPTFYKIQNLRVENQANSGWCWAYASLKCLETYLMKNDNIGKNENYNFAEYHLAYMKYKNFNNESGWKDISELDNEKIYTKGGNFDDFMKYAGILSKNIDVESTEKNFKILGPISGENTDNHEYDSPNFEQFKNKIPEYKVSKIKQFSKVKKEYDTDGKVLCYKDFNENIINVNNLEEFRLKIKEHIVNNSAIFAYINTSPSKFNQNKNSLYVNDNSLKINHAVTIVGWDDSYSKSNFNDEPKQNGAWIALNSWGDNNEKTDEGYIYISYDDAIVEQYLYGILEAEKYDENPDLNISYKRNNNKISVTISSNQKLLSPDDSWKISYTEKEFKDYYSIYETNTTLTKEFNIGEKEIVTFYDLANCGTEVEIEAKSDNSNEEITKLGDINFDNNINILDLLLLQRHLIAGNNNNWLLKEDKYKIADMNSNNKIDITDLLILKRMIIRKNL